MKIRNILLLILLFATTIAHAVPMKLSHQGRLLDSFSAPVSGSYEFTVRVYDGAVGGSPLWTEIKIVDVEEGLFSMILGETTPLDFSEIGIRPDSLWLEIQVDTDPPLSPRTRLTAAPIASHAATLQGDIHTRPGEIYVIDTLGDTTIIMNGNGDNGGNTTQIIITKIEPAGMALIGHDSSGVIRSWSTSNSLGNGVITELVAGLPPGEPLIRTEVVPPGRMSFDNIRNNGLDTTRVVEVGSYESGGFISLADSVGDTTTVIENGTVKIRRGTTIGKWSSIDIADPEFTGLIVNEVTENGPFMYMLDSLGDTTMKVNGSLKKGDKVSLIGFGTFSKSNLRADGMVVIDSLGDTTIIIDGSAANTLFQMQYDSIDGGGETLKFEFTILPDRMEFKKGIVGGGGGGGAGGTVRLEYNKLSMVDNLDDTLVTIDSLGNIYSNSTIRVGAALDETVALNINGDICYTGTIGACSDERYKKEIEPLEKSTDKILSLDGISYKWRQNEFPEKDFSAKTQIGFIAQQVEKLFPELVHTNSKGYKSVDYAKMTPVLVEALKEQQKQIDLQQKQIDELKELLTIYLAKEQTIEKTDYSQK